ncbi:N-acetylmuramoyl-L-alanine amidase [Anaerocolumna xylanovorans]|uniref:N-acetylmuramoyl-L-alanine amidase n=1 Tax=Anaerocolumna xylanovorans DSM 12503 TaxID=1121345 RepID=A0A1M7Y1G8_9FIRM|nr:N-acetylmuramoyl-L-alanine amidase [Anaerocolumna xylanovorans]SHO45624.1 N-acetylmuramoyl-L-alanine amidase [Anaerocolumna xylanovorans DSM 12503]
MNNLKNNWKLLGILAFVLLCLPFTEVSAATNLNLYLYSTKSNLVYTGNQAKYYLGSQAIDMKSTPGVVIGGTSLASFLDVFVNSGIGMNYSYDKSKGVLTLSQNGKKLVLTEGSKTAVLNGKKVTMSLAPTKIKFKNVNKTKFMVPVRFVAESFGYVYTWNSSTLTGVLTSPLHLSYSGKSVNYTGTRGSVTIDKKKVDVSDLPSIIMNDTAMVQAYKVFAASSVSADYSYDKAKKVLTLKKNTNTIELTMGSKTAKVNGRAYFMDTAPLVITNLDNNIAYVMVPGSFVASYLGYDYKWDSATKTSILTKSKIITIPDQNNNGGPELGGDPVPDTTSFSWGLSAGNLSEYTNLSSITNTAEVSQDTAVSSNINSISLDAITPNSETYAIHGSLPFSKSILTKQDSVLNLHINNTTSYIQTYTLGGSLSGNITLSPDTAAPAGANAAFSLTDPDLNYELSLSSDSCTLYVKIYRNFINTVTAGVSSGNEYLQITGMKDLKVNLSEAGNIVTLQFPATVNGIGDSSIQTTLSSIKTVTSSSIGNIAVITFEKNGSASYDVEQNGSTYRIVFNTQKTGYSVEFRIPDGLSYQDITTEDQYYKNRILIKLPGDWTSFYTQNPVQWSNSMINTVGLLAENGETKIIIDTAVLQGFKLTDLGNAKVGITIGNPRDIYKNIVVLDAGHGGTDPGAVRSLNGKTIYEKDLNYKIMYELTRKYFDNPDSEVKAYYSRYDDTLVNLYKRAEISDLVSADMFVSLHMNANTKTDPYGTEIYYYAPNTSVNSAGLNSKTLATFVLNSLTDKIGTKKRYISSQNLVVTRENHVPAILIELGFMSNKSDLTLLTNASFQEKAAKAIYDTICETFDSYPTGR